MKLILPLLLSSLATQVSGQPAVSPKPLTYEEAKAANRPPTEAAKKAIGDWVAAVAKHLEFTISAGATDPQRIRDTVIETVRPEEQQVRTALKAANWTEEQIEAALSQFAGNFLSLTSIADQVAQRKK